MSTHAADIKATHWRVDPSRSSVEFRVKMLFGMMTAKGRFTRYEGTLDLSDDPAIELAIETESLDTGNKRRDKHLRSPDFFGAEEHPSVRFVSHSATLDGDRLDVRGRLHAAGGSMPLELHAALRRDGDELEFEAAALADQRQLGMTWNFLGTVHSPVRLMVKGRLVRAT